MASRTHPWTRYTVLLLSIGLIAAIVLLYVSKIVPKTSVTIGRIEGLKRQIISYTRRSNRPPSSLSDLTAQGRATITLIDAWGELLSYSMDGNFTVTLGSLGADRKDGGIGADADLIGVFGLRLTDGSWASDDADWITNTWGLHVQHSQR